MARRQDFQNLDDRYDGGYAEQPYYGDVPAQGRQQSRQDMAAMQYENMMNGGRQPQSAAARAMPESPGPMPIIAIVLGLLAILCGATTGLIGLPALIVAAVMAIIALILGIASIVRSGRFGGNGRGKGLLAIALALLAAVATMASLMFLQPMLAQQNAPAAEQTPYDLQDEGSLAEEPEQQQAPVILNEGEDTAQQGTADAEDYGTGTAETDQGQTADGSTEGTGETTGTEDGYELVLEERTTVTSPDQISFHNWEETSDGSRLELHGDGTFVWYRDSNNRNQDTESSGWYVGNYWLMTGQEAIDFAVENGGIARSEIDAYFASQSDLTPTDYVALRLFRDHGVIDQEEIFWSEDRSAADYFGFMHADDKIMLVSNLTATDYNFVRVE